jgi:hypothetical protein
MRQLELVRLDKVLKPAVNRFFSPCWLEFMYSARNAVRLPGCAESYAA